MTRDDLEEAFGKLLSRPWSDGRSLLQALLAAADQYQAAGIEAHARPQSWPPASPRATRKEIS